MLKSTLAAAAVLAAGAIYLNGGTEDIALDKDIAVTAAWTGPKTASSEVEGTIASTKRWTLVNRLTDATCRFTVIDDGARFEPNCSSTLADSWRVRGWQAEERAVTLADAAGETVVRFEWNPETGLSSVTGEWGAFALMPAVQSR